MKKIFLLLTATACLGGCILVPAVASFKKAGLTEGDRRTLLAEDLKRFHDLLTFNNGSAAFSYIDPEHYNTVSAKLLEQAETEKIVETKIKHIQFEEGAYSATVDVSTRSFKVPFYIVNDRLERESWAFSLSDGWKIKAKDEVKKK